MNERIEQELSLLLTVHPDLERRPDELWVRLPEYKLPAGIWDQSTVELAFNLPENLPGQAPYGFWVRPGVTLASKGAIRDYTFPVTIPLGDDWGQFSWAPDPWDPRDVITAGSNMLDFVRSFSDRLREGC